ncbi:hypothetical protein TNCV_3910901 [Trichonephila clavipes]|nr:hypothetical protein TNCV_3910901 [Trichonephila clavipes]
MTTIKAVLTIERFYEDHNAALLVTGCSYLCIASECHVDVCIVLPDMCTVVEECGIVIGGGDQIYLDIQKKVRGDTLERMLVSPQPTALDILHIQHLKEQFHDH